MKPKNNAPLVPRTVAKGAAPAYSQQPPGRIPQNFKEAMLHIPVKPALNKSTNRTSETTVKTRPAQKSAAKPSADRWKSSFKPLDEQDESVDANTGSSPRVEIYDPYEPVSSDSEHEILQAQDHNQSPPDPHPVDANNLERQGLSANKDHNKKRRWASSYSESVSLSPNHDLSSETKPKESQDLSPGQRPSERQTYSQSRDLSPGQRPPEQKTFRQSRDLSPGQRPPDLQTHSQSRDLSPAQRPPERQTYSQSRDLSPAQRPPERQTYSHSRDLSPGQRLPELRQTYSQSRDLGPGQRLPEQQTLSQSRDLGSGQRLPEQQTYSQSRDLGPGQRLPERQTYSRDIESLDRPGYDSIRPLDRRVCSPDRLIHDSSAQQFPASYGGQRTNGEERRIIPEYRREMTTVRLSPPRIHRDYQHKSEYMGTGLDHPPIPPSTGEPRNRNILMDKIPIICDLCDVEFANSQELEDHLESTSHWDTLEHIQQQNNYDDLIIAFLQEVMLYKSHQCGRAIEDGALLALQENDHMTKIEMFHCAACRVFVSTSASTVHTHITSQEHLSNTKEFEVQQRRSCLDKAEIMMKELKPQFEEFLKGGSPFE